MSLFGPEEDDTDGASSDPSGMGGMSYRSEDQAGFLRLIKVGDVRFEHVVLAC